MGNRGVLLLCLVCVVGGCTALPGVSPDATTSPGPNATSGPTASAVPTGATSPTASATTAEAGTETRANPGTTSAGTDRSSPFTVEYAVRAGAVDEAFQSVTVEFEVVLAQRADDLRRCIGTLKSSRYEVTPTPLATPVSDCHPVTGITVDLATLNGTRNLGPFTAAPRYDGAHALVVRDVVPVYENGTAVTGVHDVDFRAHSREGRDPGYYGVEINVTAADADAPWQYVVSERNFEPFDVVTPTGTPSGNGTATANGTGTPAGTETDAGATEGTGTAGT